MASKRTLGEHTADESISWWYSAPLMQRWVRWKEVTSKQTSELLKLLQAHPERAVACVYVWWAVACVYVWCVYKVKRSMDNVYKVKRSVDSVYKVKRSVDSVYKVKRSVDSVYKVGQWQEVSKSKELTNSVSQCNWKNVLLLKWKRLRSSTTRQDTICTYIHTSMNELQTLWSALLANVFQTAHRICTCIH